MNKSTGHNIWGESERVARERRKHAAVKLVKVFSKIDGSFKEQLWVEGNCVVETTSGPLSAMHALECLTTEVYGSSGAFDLDTKFTKERYH